MWLGLLEAACITAEAFVRACFYKYIYSLKEFYLESNLSFLQTSRRREKAHSPP
jgi:hypothetical protein